MGHKLHKAFRTFQVESVSYLRLQYGYTLGGHGNTRRSKSDVYMSVGEGSILVPSYLFQVEWNLMSTIGKHTTAGYYTPASYN